MLRFLVLRLAQFFHQRSQDLFLLCFAQLVDVFLHPIFGGLAPSGLLRLFKLRDFVALSVLLLDNLINAQISHGARRAILPKPVNRKPFQVADCHL